MKGKKRKCNEGTPWYQSAPGAISGLGAGILATGANDEEFNGTDYAGNVLSSVGAMAGAGSAFGPIGTGVGAAIGLGMGIVNSEKQKKEYEKAKRLASIRKRIGTINGNLLSLNTATQAQRLEAESSNNMRLPGFKKGTSSFYGMYNGAPNAMIANGEGIKNQETGQLDVVPGQYDRSNPDKVNAAILPGTSIYPNHTPLYGGTSTSADLISKMSKVQKRDNAILSGKNPVSRLDKKTAELNSKNIDIQSELLNMNTFISNAKKMKTNKYKNGTASAILDGVYGAANAFGAAAPIIYNLGDQSPEIVNPVYDNLYTPSIRANVSKNLDDARRQRQIARYNNRTLNSGSGIGTQYAGATYAAGINNTSDIYSAADQMNNQYRLAEADAMNKVASSNKAEDRRVQDLNARNRAASRSFKAKGLEQISQFTQNNELMSNQKERDELNAKVWSKYAAYLDPSVRAEFLKELGIDTPTQKANKPVTAKNKKSTQMQFKKLPAYKKPKDINGVINSMYPDYLGGLNPMSYINTNKYKIN